MQCPIDKAPHTMAFDISVMGTLRKCSSATRALLRLNLTTLGFERENDTPRPPGRPIEVGVVEVRVILLRVVQVMSFFFNLFLSTSHYNMVF